MVSPAALPPNAHLPQVGVATLPPPRLLSCLSTPAAKLPLYTRAHPSGCESQGWQVDYDMWQIDYNTDEHAPPWHERSASASNCSAEACGLVGKAPAGCVGEGTAARAIPLALPGLSLQHPPSISSTQMLAAGAGDPASLLRSTCAGARAAISCMPSRVINMSHIRRLGRQEGKRWRATGPV